jgi:hypothetical protein
MRTAASVIRQRLGWVLRCGILRVFAVYCKRLPLISMGFSPLFGIYRQYQGLGGNPSGGLQNRLLRFNSGRGLHQQNQRLTAGFGEES